MSLEPGLRLGPYEVVSPLGAGGMGEVYRALDTKLGRHVAIKVLPEAFAKDADARARFEREARAVAALSHPSILSIFDFGDADGIAFAVMEFLEGETLRDLLDRGSLPLRRALEIAVQIAEGLAAAHEKGIVHRDIKPSNVFLTNDGRTKILDFGLARHDAASPEQGDTRSPTVEKLTEPGSVVGTVSYMSPEQAKGVQVDFRSDQFSFGILLYEMLSGVRPFRGGSAAETMTAIIREEPEPLARGQAAIPGPVTWTVERCLAKQPEGRYAATRDLASDLRTLERRLSEMSSASKGVSIPPLPGIRRGWRPAHLGAALLAAVIGGALLAPLVGQWGSKAPVSLQRLSFRRGMIWSGRFTPDGQTILFSAAWDGEPVRLFSTRPGGIEGRPLDLPPAKVLSISESGDIAFLRDPEFVFFYYQPGTLARVPLAGGTARDLLENVTAADWIPGGDRLAVARRSGEKWRVEFPLGKTVFETGGRVHDLRVSPDGLRVAFFDVDQGSSSVMVVSRSGEVRILSPGWARHSRGLAFSRDGREIWFTATKEMDTRESHVLRGVSFSGDERVVYRIPGDLELLDIARDGRVLLAEWNLRIGLRGATATSGGEKEWSWMNVSYVYDLSRDGSRVAFSDVSGIFARRTDGSPAVQLSADEWVSEAGRLSPDASRLVTFRGKGPKRLVVIPVGAGETREFPSTEGAVAADWLPDGRRVVCALQAPGAGTRLRTVDVESDRAEDVALPPELAGKPWLGLFVSPDGDRLAAALGGGEIWLVGPRGEKPLRVPGTIGSRSVIGWTADARSLFLYRIGDVPGRVARLDVSTGEVTPWKELIPPDRDGLLRIHPVRVTPDGRSYAYSYSRVLSRLYLAEGLR